MFSLCHMAATRGSIPFGGDGLDFAGCRDTAARAAGNKSSYSGGGISDCRCIWRLDGPGNAADNVLAVVFESSSTSEDKVVCAASPLSVEFLMSRAWPRGRRLNVRVEPVSTPIFTDSAKNTSLLLCVVVVG